MVIHFISLQKENKPEGYKNTVIGRKVSQHNFYGHVFYNSQDAENHQNTLLNEERGGIIAAQEGQLK